MSLIKRQQFRAIVQAGAVEQVQDLMKKEEDAINNLAKQNGISFLRIYNFGEQLFLYLEGASLIKSVPLPQNINNLLQDWPATKDFDNIKDSVKWSEMLDIFHDAMPRNGIKWRDSDNIRTSVGSIIYLRPEKYASYVYYHFQLQEEGLKKFNKYFIIGAHENCLFSYYEIPAVIDPWNEDRLLRSNNSPDNWAELMGEHFQPWAEGLKIDDPWRVMQEVFSFPPINK